MNSHIKYLLGLLLAVGIWGMSGCQSINEQPEYLPGYYQEAQYHPARYEYAYYDYYGNYHASYQREAYWEPGRWHRAPVVSADKIGVSNYIEAALAEEEATEALGDVADEGAVIEPVVE